MRHRALGRRGGASVSRIGKMDGWRSTDRSADGSYPRLPCFSARAEEREARRHRHRVRLRGYLALPRRLLHFLASLRDQYSFATLTLPADLPLNRMLRETQLPHRLVNHPHAEMRPFTRMQIRVLDHKRLIEAMHLPEQKRGQVVVSVQESEGHESRFAVELSAGARERIRPPTPRPRFLCADRMFVPIVCGDLKATCRGATGTGSRNSIPRRLKCWTFSHLSGSVLSRVFLRIEGSVLRNAC